MRVIRCLLLVVFLVLCGVVDRAGAEVRAEAPPEWVTASAPVTMPAEAWLFAEGVVNADTLSYLVLKTEAPQRVTVRYAIEVGPGRMMEIDREYDLAAWERRSLYIAGTPGFPSVAAFATRVTFEQPGLATIVMRPVAAPWSNAIMPPARVVDLSKPDGPATIFFGEGVVNAETTTWLVLYNASDRQQEIEWEYGMDGSAYPALRFGVLEAGERVAIKINSDPFVTGGFSTRVDCERVCAASLVMRRTSDLWADAMFPQPRVIERQ